MGNWRGGARSEGRTTTQLQRYHLGIQVQYLESPFLFSKEMPDTLT